MYAQNVHWAAEGAFTGEVSAPMLLELGVEGAIVGHSERRQYFGETDETVRLRCEAALAAGLAVIACVGETDAQREAGETEAVLRRQVAVIPRDERLVIAYEPVWAIGTGKTATPEIAQHAHSLIKDLHDTRVLYGGSVKPENAADLLGSLPSTERSSAAPRSRSSRSRRSVAQPRRELGRLPLVTLVILDGWGIAPPGPGNAVELAETPVFDALVSRYPTTQLGASGGAVGLPEGQMGNSEVGHLTIGSGRILYQDLVRVTRAVEDGSFFENAALVGAFERARERGGAVHLLGLVSNGGVHSHIEHLRALLELARRQGMSDETWLHVFTDGRDVSPQASVRDLATLPAERVATVVGRYYGMDRDSRWERTDRAVAAIVDAVGELAEDPIAAVRASYDQGVTDEFVEPSSSKAARAWIPRRTA